MRFGYGTDLLEQLRPGLDALIIEDGLHRALFLPAMWRQVSDSRQFLGQLKHKAGCPPITGHQRSRLPASLAVDIKQEPPNVLQLLIGCRELRCARWPGKAQQESPK
jgi:hypothetical protein